MMPVALCLALMLFSCFWLFSDQQDQHGVDGTPPNTRWKRLTAIACCIASLLCAIGFFGAARGIAFTLIALCFGGVVLLLTMREGNPQERSN